jgi:hypothetical protein
MHEETKAKFISSIPGIRYSSINTMYVYFVNNRSPVAVGRNDHGMLYYKIDGNLNDGWKLLTLAQLNFIRKRSVFKVCLN